MTQRPVDLSPRAWSRLAGACYLAIIVCGIAAEFFVREPLRAGGDAAAAIAAAEGAFRVGIAADLVMLLCDVVVGVALFVLLERVSRGLALLAAGLRLVHAAIYGANLLNLFLALKLSTGGAAGVDAAQAAALGALFLDLHATGYLIGLVFFGLHCAVLGHMVFRTGVFPRALGVLLGLAALGYLTDGFAQILLTTYTDYESIFQTIVFVPALVGELSLGLWLLWKGVDEDRSP